MSLLISTVFILLCQILFVQQYFCQTTANSTEILSGSLKHLNQTLIIKYIINGQNFTEQTTPSEVSTNSTTTESTTNIQTTTTPLITITTPLLTMTTPLMATTTTTPVMTTTAKPLMTITTPLLTMTTPLMATTTTTSVMTTTAKPLMTMTTPVLTTTTPLMITTITPLMTTTALLTTTKPLTTALSAATESMTTLTESITTECSTNSIVPNELTSPEEIPTTEPSMESVATSANMLSTLPNLYPQDLTYVCPKEVNGCNGPTSCLYKSSKCTQYYQCNDGGQAFLRNCAPGTLWNDQKKVCDFPLNSNCSN